jgi:hypothetical protein
MICEPIEEKLKEELAVAQLRFSADPDSEERRSELEIALRRYEGVGRESELRWQHEAANSRTAWA